MCAAARPGGDRCPQIYRTQGSFVSQPPRRSPLLALPASPRRPRTNTGTVRKSQPAGSGGQAVRVMHGTRSDLEADRFEGIEASEEGGTVDDDAGDGGREALLCR